VRRWVQALQTHPKQILQEWSRTHQTGRLL